MSHILVLKPQTKNGFVFSNQKKTPRNIFSGKKFFIAGPTLVMKYPQPYPLRRNSELKTWGCDVTAHHHHSDPPCEPIWNYSNSLA